MTGIVRWAVVFITLLVLPSQLIESAAAQSACMKRFVGPWTWIPHGYQALPHGGSSVDTEVKSDGSVRVAGGPWPGRWHCEGNKYWSDLGAQLTMAPDGKRLTGSAAGVAITMIRRGAAPRENVVAQSRLRDADTTTTPNSAVAPQAPNKLSLPSPVKVCGGKVEVQQAIFFGSQNRGFIKLGLPDGSTFSATLDGSALQRRSRGPEAFGTMALPQNNNEWDGYVANMVSDHCDQLLQPQPKPGVSERAMRWLNPKVGPGKVKGGTGIRG